MHIIEATSSGWYVEKEYRGNLGIEIIKKADELLKQAGVNETSYILNGERASKILKRQGFKPEQTVWSRKYGQ